MAAAGNGRLAAMAAKVAAPPPLAPIPAPPPSFPSYLDASPGSLDPRAFALCEILSKVSEPELELALSRSGIIPTSDVVEAVLRHSYSSPASAVRFFRWAALSSPHSPIAWNLMVDLLGKNGLFDAMWDAIRSMRDEPSSPLAPATFISAFGSYCSAGRIKEAIMTFDVMDRYGVPQDVFAVNSLLSAICRMDGGYTAVAVEFFERVKTKIAPDADTFAILLEGWEKEGNIANAKLTFGEMVIRLGWDPKNMSAHDAFLNTLVHGNDAGEAMKFLQVMKSKGCLPGMKFFANALDILVRQKDLVHATTLWDTMVGSGLLPNTIMYNAMIALLCDHRNIESSWQLLDDMALQGAFPDSLTYNTIFECLVKNKKADEAEKFFVEMRKNDWPPSPENCLAAIRMFFEEFDPQAAVEVWRCVTEEHVPLRNECANELLVGLCNLGRMSDVKRYADDMLDMRIRLDSSTMMKLKSGFQKARKLDLYDSIERKLHIFDNIEKRSRMQ